MTRRDDWLLPEDGGAGGGNVGAGGVGGLSNSIELGRSRFLARPMATSTLAVTACPQDVRSEIRAVVPDEPGVYAMVDRDDAVAYVGKSIQLRERVLNYFVDAPSEAAGKSRPRKEHRVGLHARRLLWQPVGHELVALLRELELIQSLRPRFNVRGAADRGRSGFVYLTADEAPTFRTGTLPSGTAVRTWGPLLLTRFVREGVERLNHTFGLRDCTTKVHIVYRDQGLLWDEPSEAGCLRAAFGACLAPCAHQCSRDEYSAAVRRAVAFLDGADRSVLTRLEQDMAMAASERKFERAARLRDTWDALDSLEAELSLVRDSAGGVSAFVLPVPGGHGEGEWLLFSGGVPIGAILPPTKPTWAASTADVLTAYAQNGRGEAATAVDFECEAVRTTAGWFRANPAAVDAALSLDEARDACERVLASAAVSSRD